MRVGEAQARLRQPIHVWRLQSNRAVAAHIAVAEIVGENENDVGLGRISGEARTGQCEQI